MGETLQGIRVLDLTRVMSGPFATLMLADLGADVIKVESRRSGDVMRHMGGHQRGGVAAIFLGLNRGKRSISVDLRRPEGQDLVRELALGCDVLIENFRPGVCDDMGLGAARLRAEHPELIYISMSGFGPASPASNEPAYDTMMQGRTGMVARQRRGRVGRPDLVRSFAVDKITGFFAVQATLAALFARSRGAGGQTISIPMFDASLYYLWADSLTDLAFVGEGVRPGTLFPLSVDLTETADGFLTHLAITDRERAAVARAVGRADLTVDIRFSTTKEWSKPENLRVHQQAIAEAFRGLSTAEAMARLRAEDVPCAAVAEPEDILADEHVRATGVLAEYEDAHGGRVRQPRYPTDFSTTAVVGHDGSAPTLGGDGPSILAEAGFDAARIDVLIRSGVIDAGEDRRGAQPLVPATDSTRES
jgi:crotonobetainyl-CoA:carnitine CoA-transferase CaiB-like acyl-CoA transferase